MLKILAKAGETIMSDYPPTMVLVSARNDYAVLLRITHPDETIEDLQREAKVMRAAQAAMNRREVKRRTIQ